jgi:hypothetical protein
MDPVHLGVTYLEWEVPVINGGRLREDVRRGIVCVLPGIRIESRGEPIPLE